VNVLFFDWHAEFDGRSWPSPIGTLTQQNAGSGDWVKLSWDPASSDCVADYFGRNVVPE
jgi:hypothetical protein